jgi:hypothetical protein
MPFKPGQSGNPGGRPKGWAEVNALARQHTAAAIEALVKSLDDRRTRVQAAQALLDRGWGKPMQAVELATPDVVMAHQFDEALERLSLQELEQLIALSERMGMGLEGAERSADAEANVVPLKARAAEEVDVGEPSAEPPSIPAPASSPPPSAPVLPSAPATSPAATVSPTPARPVITSRRAAFYASARRRA